MRLHPLVGGIAITLLRFAVMVATLELAEAAGVGGLDLGLVTNVAVTVLAVVLMTRRRLWRASGATTAWRSWTAAAALVPLVVESVSWALPGGLVPEEPGYPLWATTLLPVGVNEELISRGVILSRLISLPSPDRRALDDEPAVGDAPPGRCGRERIGDDARREPTGCVATQTVSSDNSQRSDQRSPGPDSESAGSGFESHGPTGESVVFQLMLVIPASPGP